MKTIILSDILMMLLKPVLSLTNRYISDRYLPDKAIDALDEAGARVHISNIHVPAEIINY